MMTTTMATATARWVVARQDKTMTTMATGDDKDDDDDDSATMSTMKTMAMVRRVTGYDDDGNNDGGGQ